MTVEQAISSVTALTIEEQLLVVQSVWKQMPSTSGTALTDAQRAEFERRVQLYEQHPERALTEEEFRAKLRDAGK